MRAAALLLVAILLAPASVRATELHYGAEIKGLYNSNVFASPSNVQDDGSFRGSPFVELRDPDGKFRWNFKYDPSYEQYVTLTNLSGWDQDVNGGFTWLVSPLVALTVSDRFDQFHSLTRFNQAVGVPSGGTSVETIRRRNKFIYNAASVSLRLQMTPTQTLVLNGDHYLWRFTGNNGRDQQTMDAGLRYSKAMSERLKLGSELSWSRQYFAALGSAPSQQTDYYHVGGVAQYDFDPTFNVSLTAGPTLVVPPSPTTPNPVFLNQPYPIYHLGNNLFAFRDINTCPTLPDGTPFYAYTCQPFGFSFDGTTGIPFLEKYGKTIYFAGPRASSGANQLTYFANASVSKVWQNWTFTLSYRRQANQSSGVGTSSIADIVYGSIHWNPTVRWSLYLNAAWIRRSQQGSSSLTVYGLAANPDGAAPYPNAAEVDSLRSLQISNGAEFDTTNLNGYAGYRLTKRITLFGFGSWNRTVQSRSFLQTTRTNIFTFWTGIRYEFEPIHF